MTGEITAQTNQQITKLSFLDRRFKFFYVIVSIEVILLIAGKVLSLFGHCEPSFAWLIGNCNKSAWLSLSFIFYSTIILLPLFGLLKLVIAVMNFVQRKKMASSIMALLISFFYQPTAEFLGDIFEIGGHNYKLEELFTYSAWSILLLVILWLGFHYFFSRVENKNFIAWQAFFFPTIFLAGYAIIIFFIYSLPEKQKTISYLPASSQKTPGSSAKSGPPVDTVVNSSGVKTYKDESYAFEIQYPKNWELKIHPAYMGGISLYPPGSQEVQGELALSINPVGPGRESVFDIGSQTKTENYVFAGRKARIYNCPLLNPCPLQLVYSKSIRMIDVQPNWTVSNEIDYSLPKGYGSLRAEYESILASFKFTN